MNTALMAHKERMVRARLFRQKMDERDLENAKSKGMVAPQVGDVGVYSPGSHGPYSFTVTRIEGMICHCTYDWQDPTKEPHSTFIWGFLRDGQHNTMHTWPGHPQWTS